MDLVNTSGKKSSSLCNLQVMLQYFPKHDHIKFKYDHTDSHQIDIDIINSTIVLKYYYSSTNVYTLDLEDNDAPNQFVINKK